MIKYECPICLNSSGIVADGKGSKCKTCNGLGYIGKGLITKLRKELGSIIDMVLFKK